MPVQTRRAAWAAAGIFAVGGVTGLAAPQLLRTAAPGVERTRNVSLPADSATHGPIPLGVAPNYRAIVDQNQAAVVGIMTAGEMKVSGPQQEPFGPQFETHRLGAFPSATLTYQQ